VTIKQPILLLHSKESVTDFTSTEQVKSRDAILNVNNMVKKAELIQANMDVISIPGGMHDLVLSEKDVREKAYLMIFDWLKVENM
jgi:alpha-beta hydrolase superfamily lysophospholipase